jgi:CRP/FNR family cyclic AMP-dependent transcriptional regulator
MPSPLLDLLDRADFPEGDYWHRQRFHGNDVLLREGEPNRRVYVLLEGRARVFRQVDLEHNRNIKPGFCDIDTGESFGELCLFDKEPRSASVVAVSDGEAAIIDGPRLLEFLDARPELASRVYKHMLRTLVGRLRKANERVAWLFAWGLKIHGIAEHL